MGVGALGRNDPCRTRGGTSQKLRRNDRVWGGRGADRPGADRLWGGSTGRLPSPTATIFSKGKLISHPGCYVNEELLGARFFTGPCSF